MSRIFLPALLAASLLAAAAGAAPVVRGSLVYDGIPEAESAEALDAYLSAREATPLGFTPKDQLLIATRFGDVEQLHLVEHPLGERRQITFLRRAVTQAAFSPDPSRNAFFYVADSAGDARPQIYYQRLGEPRSRRLTDGKSVNGRPGLVQLGTRDRFLLDGPRQRLLRHRHRGCGKRRPAASRGERRRRGLVSARLVARRP